MKNLDHNLFNIPECKTCSDYDRAFGGSCSYENDEWFICPKITEHLKAMRLELELLMEQQDRMMRTIPKSLRGRGHLIDVETVLGDPKYRRLECFGTATSQDACLQCPDNNECADFTCSKTKKKAKEGLK